MGTLKSKKIDYVPTIENVKDPQTKKILEDFVTIISKIQKDVHDDLRDHEDRIIDHENRIVALEP